MNFSQLAQVRDELLRNRQYAIAAGVIVVALFLSTLIGGLVLFRRALDDNRPPSASVVNVPTKIGLLFSYDEPRDVVNHIVFFNDVRLEAGPADDLYYAVGANGSRVLVISNGKKAVTADAQVDLKGTVRMLPAETTLKSKWKLSKEEIAPLRKQGIYIEAEEITPQHGVPMRVAKSE